MKNKITKIDIKTETDIWNRIKKRADEIQKKSELMGKLSDTEKEKIFRERAEKLSQIEKKSDKGKDLIKIISFNIGSELYGIDIKYLNEVYEVYKITAIPCTPQAISGLINLRGGIVTVLNLSSLLNPSSEKLPPALQKGEIEGGHKILILGNEGIRTGIRVDSFGALYDLSRDSIRPVSSIFLERNKIIKHEFPISNISLWIIDVEELLNDERLIVNEDV